MLYAAWLSLVYITTAHSNVLRYLYDFLNKLN